MAYQFSHRIDESPVNPVAREAARLRAQGISLSAMNDSNPTHWGLAPSALPQEYTADPRGDASARAGLARFLRERRGKEHADDTGSDPVSEDSLYILSSTSQAYMWLFMLLCDPSDAVLGPKPGYPLIESIARLASVEAVPYTLFYDGQWNIDLEAMEGIIHRYASEGRKIKAAVLINPNNPTGSYVRKREREGVIRLCRENNIAVIADEVFFGYPFMPVHGRGRIAGENRVLTFALDGLSKALAAPHAKVGWIQVSGPGEDAGEAMRRLDIIADDFLPLSQFQVSALPGLLNEVPSRTEAVLRRIQENLGTLRRMLGQEGGSTVDMLNAEGGWNVLLKFPASVDENTLALELLDSCHIVPQPGYFFDMPSDGYVTLSLLPDPEVFRAHVRALLAAVDGLVQGPALKP